MSPALTFVLGLAVLALFGWYFTTDPGPRKRLLGLVLITALVVGALFSIYPPDKKIHLGLDLQGGTEFLIRLVKENPNATLSPQARDTAVEVIRSRVDQFGVSEPVITPVGTDSILVQIPGLDAQKINDTRDTLQRVAKLEFKLVDPQSAYIVQRVEAGQDIVPPGYMIVSGEDEEDEALTPPNGADPKKKNAPKRQPEKLVVRTGADMTGEHITNAAAINETQGWVVHVRFDSKGAREFGDLTAAHVNERLAILLDGKVVSAPNLRSAIRDGNCEISGGSFTDKSAHALSSALENPLSTPVKIESERTVSSTLGESSIRQGVKSGIIGVLITFIFVLWYYRFAGLLANIALLVNIVLLFGLMTSLNFVLTLPGIAGIILTIGLSIDANVLIYERLREELAAGKTLRPAIEGAYNKAFSSIFDANVTTLITSVILFIYASGPVKGFAVALTVGILASLFSALIVTRNGFAWATDKFGLERIKMLHFFENPNFDFMGKARLCAIGSVVVLALSALVFGLRGQKNFGIDFKGGDLTVLTANRALQEGAVRDVLKGIGRQEATIENTEVKGQPALSILSPEETGKDIQAAVTKAFPDAGVKLAQYDKIGARVGKQLAQKSLYALGFGILAILVYVSMRFEFSFAVGAIVALLHDVLITLGVFALLGRELSLVMVGAVLTIAGYSINDTIVVYDRIRSGLREGRKGSVREIMNASINETLGRTILTGGMTLVTVVALFIGGGPVLNDFALAILIGVLVGTYSSVFIASPIVLWFSKGEKGRLRQEVSRGSGGPALGGGPDGDNGSSAALPAGSTRG